MTMPEDIAFYLRDCGMGVYESEGISTISIGGFKEYYENNITLFQYAGFPPLLKQLDTIEHLSLQILTRDLVYVNSLELIEKITRILDQTRPTINGTFYPLIMANQSPFFMELTENEHYIFGVNLSVARRYTED
ncbi:hypothetical protein AGMMS49975_15040 [Clostridia bacterium]|nr:hypothetical protein AGMMS49975_15040 [Clostridia bacterium]